jgi:hypothetical protein
MYGREKLGGRGRDYMMDQPCDECERVWQAYEYANQSQRIIERKSAMETGLEVLLRKSSNRCEEARKAVEDHEATHLS